MNWREPAQSVSEGCRGAAFFASPGRWTKVWCHHNMSKRYQVSVDGSEVSCHDEIVKVESKKQGTSAPALAEGGVGLQPY